MKKVTLLLLVFLGIFLSCKKETQVSSSKVDAIQDSTLCEELKKEIQGSTPEERALWLFQNPQKFCNPKVYLCSEETHNIGVGKYNEIVLSYLNEYNQAPKYYPFTWSEINNMIRVKEQESDYNCYKYYLCIEDIDNNDCKISLVNKFSLDKTCYSIPLLKGVASVNSLKPYDTFVFTKANVTFTGFNSKVEYVFSVKNNFYDLSDDPGFKSGVKSAILSPF